MPYLNLTSIKNHCTKKIIYVIADLIILNNLQ